jgi:hypothetical protein
MESGVAFGLCEAAWVFGCGMYRGLEGSFGDAQCVLERVDLIDGVW